MINLYILREKTSNIFIEKAKKFITKEFNFRLSEILINKIINDNSDLDKIYVVDQFFDILNQYINKNNDIYILFVKARLVTEFGYRISAEARDNKIVISSISSEDASIERLIRHEIGHCFGLKEHLDCAMSPYYVEDPTYCNACKKYLYDKGIITLDYTNRDN